MMKRIGIYLYDQVEVLDFAGPFEVFTSAARLTKRLSPGSSTAFEVDLIALKPGVISARGGLSVNVAYGISEHPPLDVWVIPGGVVTEELSNKFLINWLQDQAASVDLLCSVCTGAFLLAEAGLLDGKRATTHWEDIPEFAQNYPQVIVDAQARWVEDGKIITAAGISAGIDMALYLVSRLAGEQLALITARQMDYSWQI